MDLGLREKVAIVAGSSRGLGKAVANELANEGVNVVLCSRGGDALQSAHRELVEKHGVGVEAVEVDLSSEEGPDQVVQAALERFGQVDILVSNNGGPPPGRFEELPAEAWERAFHLTLDSVLRFTRAVLPGMKERGWGRILNITSISVKQPVENLILSNSLRAAVTGFAKTLSNEVGLHGITVNNILPGFTRTERLTQLADNLAAQQGIDREKVFEVWEQGVPLGRIGEPSEFAAMAAFLVSERASYITGVSVPVDGGWIRAVF